MAATETNIIFQGGITMLLDLGKYNNLKTYQRYGKECYMDNITKQLCPKTPEETVRQKVIQWLIKEIEVPEYVITVEELMAHYERSNTKRADICIYARMMNDTTKTTEDFPLMVIECKNEDIPLTDDVFYQCDDYASVLGAPLMAITNGIDMELYRYNEAENCYDLLKDFPKYKDLCEPINLEAYPKFKVHYTRYTNYFNTTEELFDTLYDHGLIGKSTDIKFCPVIAKMIDCLLNDSCILESLDIEGCTFLKDNGVRNTSFGNCAGGSYPGDYRSFAILDGKGNTQIVSIGIFGTAERINDSKFGNRKSKTTLNVAIDDFEKSHNSLQLNLDSHLRVDCDMVTVTHDGKLTKGKSGAVKSEQVRDYIRANSKIRVSGKELFLGSWKNTDEYDINDGNIKQFLANLIKYAILRDEYRNL